MLDETEPVRRYWLTVGKVPDGSPQIAAGIGTHRARKALGCRYTCGSTLLRSGKLSLLNGPETATMPEKVGGG